MAAVVATVVAAVVCGVCVWWGVVLSLGGDQGTTLREIGRKGHAAFRFLVPIGTIFGYFPADSPSFIIFLINFIRNLTYIGI